MKTKFIMFLVIVLPLFLKAQHIPDTMQAIEATGKSLLSQRIYLEKNGDPFIYNKPKTFGFATNIPGNYARYIQQSFKKEHLYKVGIVAASTTLLFIFDQNITDGIQSLSRHNNISAVENFSPIVRVNLLGKKPTSEKCPEMLTRLFTIWGRDPRLL